MCKTWSTHSGILICRTFGKREPAILALISKSSALLSPVASVLVLLCVRGSDELVRRLCCLMPKRGKCFVTSLLPAALDAVRETAGLLPAFSFALLPRVQRFTGLRFTRVFMPPVDASAEVGEGRPDAVRVARLVDERAEVDGGRPGAIRVAPVDGSAEVGEALTGSGSGRGGEIPCVLDSPIPRSKNLGLIRGSPGRGMSTHRPSGLTVNDAGCFSIIVFLDSRTRRFKTSECAPSRVYGPKCPPSSHSFTRRATSNSCIGGIFEPRKSAALYISSFKIILRLVLSKVIFLPVRSVLH
mmetsp:Transcript_56138/g.76566  ORF Transcript_56138/g.76566 Transcript_56138/m.76566 type:complete len:299 (+) Transcript_56138:1282-2178(+)